MHFVQLLQALDELLYEIMSWLVFFPITLWRSLTRPLKTMAYSDRELEDEAGKQYDDTLSPPLYLLIALLVTHGFEMAFVGGVNPIVASRQGLAVLVADDTSLLVLRLALFSLLPLVLAVSLLIGQGRRVTRPALKAPFYAQCYPAANFALLAGISGIVMQGGVPALELTGAAILLVALVMYLSLEVVWFRRHLQSGTVRAVVHSAGGFAAGLALFAAVAALFI